MSRTDKDRPYLVQISDPLNQRFRMVTSQKRWSGGFWKKMHPATQCWCCSNKYWVRFKRQRRSGWKREVKY